MNLDETDKRLLRALQRKGRASHAELSEMVNLSPSACHRRVQRLERAGAITGYVALVAPAAVECKTIVFVEITLTSQSQTVLDAFERAATRVPEILECYLMAGSADYLLKVTVADSEDFARLHRRALSTLPGVAQMQSSFAMRTVRATTALPI